MSRCRSSHKVISGAILPASGTSRAVTGWVAMPGGADDAGAAMASTAPKTAAAHKPGRALCRKSGKAIMGRIIAEIAAIRRRVAPSTDASRGMAALCALRYRRPAFAVEGRHGGAAHPGRRYRRHRGQARLARRQGADYRHERPRADADAAGGTGGAHRDD